MASVTSRAKGLIEVQFTDHNRKRRTLRMGRVSRREADDFARELQRLVDSRRLGQRPSRRSLAWLDDIGLKYRQKLTRWGIVDGNLEDVFLEQLIKSHEVSLDVEDSTLRNIRDATRNLTRHFGASCPIASIRQNDAIRFRTWLAQHGSSKNSDLAEATVSRRVRRAQEVFEYAAREGWIDANPFGPLKRGSERNQEKDFYFDKSLFTKIHGSVVCLEFKAALSLVRWAGLRCPSEVLGLKWEDVNWERSTICVASPKTKRHPEGKLRVIPIFRECRPDLDRLWASLGDRPATLLFPELQHNSSALRSRLGKACKKAGVAMPPRPFDNMRATRESELLEEFPIHTVAAWFGHSPQVALQHYAQIAKEHHTRAVGSENALKSAGDTEQESLLYVANGR
jgi:integrase